jgi:DNA-directed RNA polymerase specialized sigma24 family protein
MTKTKHARYTAPTRKSASERLSDDQTLVDDLLRRDAKAWREFDQRFRPQMRQRVKSVVRFSLVARREIDDIVANVLCALLADDCAKLRRFDATKAPLEAWILIITKNKALSYLRAVRCRPLALSLDDLLEIEDSDTQAGARWIAEGL